MESKFYLVLRLGMTKPQASCSHCNLHTKDHWKWHTESKKHSMKFISSTSLLCLATPDPTGSLGS